MWQTLKKCTKEMSVTKMIINDFSLSSSGPIKNRHENILIISYKQMKRCVKNYIPKMFPTGTIGNFDTADKVEKLDIIDVEMIIGELKTDAIKIHKTAV